ncbi:MAG: hypothetical protein C5S38_01080 [Candidatus Methanophagaceae archaeon]|nr:MAG: hypothetical protein C5S38_01080 [Methanophagales archaeon]
MDDSLVLIPSMRTWPFNFPPAEWGTMPFRIWQRVLFPDPFSPITASNSPFGMLRFNFLITVLSVLGYL